MFQILNVKSIFDESNRTVPSIPLSKSLRLFCFTLFLFFSLPILNAEIIKEDYRRSLTRHGLDEEHFYHKLVDPKTRLEYEIDRENFAMMKKLYKRNFINSLSPKKKREVRIPRTIHQIWLGSPVPEHLKKWMESWTKCKGWKYKLWTDEEIKDFPIYNRRIFDLRRNYAEQANVLRYEILFREGGLYVDTDFECLNPEFFEYLHQTLDFYAGTASITYPYNYLVTGNALIGSKPGHKLLKSVIEGMEENYSKTAHLINPERSGPLYFSRNILQFIRNNPKEKIVLFPCSYFFPHPYRRDKNQIMIFPESAAIHYWEASWVH